MMVFLVWIDDAYDSRDLHGVFSSEERAQEWIESNLDTQESKHAYIENHYID